MEGTNNTVQVENVQRANIPAILSLVFGITGLSFMFVEIAALVLGIIGIKGSYKVKTGKGMAIAGLILGAIAFSYKAIVYTFVFSYLIISVL